LNFLTSILVGAGLSMDVFAVSVAAGIAAQKINIKDAGKVASVFGSFQALMFFFGFVFGMNFKKYIESFDHWIAFTILCAIGVRMIIEGARRLESCCKKIDYFNPATLLFLGISTSIDALAVGLSFSFISANSYMPSITIGVVTFIISIVGMFLGDKLSCRFRQKSEILGGMILVGIGTKILVEHLGGLA